MTIYSTWLIYPMISPGNLMTEQRCSTKGRSNNHVPQPAPSPTAKGSGRGNPRRSGEGSPRRLEARFSRDWTGRTPVNPSKPFVKSIDCRV